MAIRRLLTHRMHERPDDSWTLEATLDTGGYESWRRALDMEPAQLRDEVEASGLRGRGGAGFPAFRKWGFLPEGSFPRYLVVNADEGEPSTFKDRMLIERDPHQLVEGVAIAARSIESSLAFIYIRGEFALGYDRLVAAIEDARARGFVGEDVLGSGVDLDIIVHRGAGAYICGEETALLESLEGLHGMPRIRPPFPAVEGLYAKPTIVNNVETLSALPAIVEMSGSAYGDLGVGRSTGTRILSLSGHVKRPGNYEVELGTTFRELMFDPELGGGIRADRRVSFFIPGGASSQWLTGADEHLDAPLDMDQVIQDFGVMLGSGAVMVYDETACPVRVAWRLAKFFAHESCGKCTPCREGTGWLTKVLHRVELGDGRKEDLDLLLDVGDNICPGLNAPFSQTTICPLGPSSVSAIVSLDKFFRSDVEDHVREGRCPHP